jgi:hypothetical protein
VLRAIGFEVLVVLTLVKSMLVGELKACERERLALAAVRIQSALNAAGVSHV